MLASKYSFKLISDRISAQKSESATVVVDDDKRSFLKLAGIVGAGVVASQLLPKKAEALVFGSTPASNTVGVKNAANQKVNPATEETVADIKTQTDKLNFTGEDLKVVTGPITGTVNLKNVAGTNINPATEDTLSALNTKATALATLASDDSVILLRRMVKVMESQATVDSSNRQRVAVEAMPTTAVTLSSLATVTTVNQISGVDGKFLLIDTARNAYATGVRNNLVWS